MVLKILVGVVVSGVFGLLYYKFVACPNGTCLLTFKPIHIVMTIVYGVLMGVVFSKLLFSILIL